MTRRRITWIIHNTLMITVIPIRLVLFGLSRIGEGAEWLLNRAPGLRRYNGWSGW